jgi:mono/diheme cytochrome c family protein
MKKLLTIAFALACSASGPGRAEDKVDFAKQIQPILRQNCVKCHGPEKQKGKLRLDSKEVAMKGGKDGVVIVAGDADRASCIGASFCPRATTTSCPTRATR